MAKGLVLAGGGAKGSYQVGVSRALKELGWRPDVITGASVGCLNAALFALDREPEAAQLWKSLDVHSVLVIPEEKNRDDQVNFLLETLKSGGLDLEPLGEVIQRYLKEEDLRAARTGYGLVLTEMGTMKSIQCPLADIPQGMLKEYMLASSACFPALRPREIAGVKYIDGGWRDNMPLDLAKQMGATELIGVDVDGVGYTRPNTTGLPTRILRSHWDLGPLFEFDGKRAERNIALGYLDTLRAFGRVGGTAYAILPAEDGFARAFSKAYCRVLGEVSSRAPALRMAEAAARALHHYPPVYEPDPDAPTRGALAPLELSAELAEVPAEVPMTEKQLALTWMGSVSANPAEKFRSLFEGEAAVAETALAVAVPDDFVQALTAQALAEL